MKKINVLILMFVSLSAFAGEINGSWQLKSFTWEDEFVFVGEIEFFDSTYTMHSLSGEDYTSNWHMEEEYLFLGSCGFVFERVDSNHIKITPAFGDASAKYYILSRGK